MMRLQKCLSTLPVKTKLSPVVQQQQRAIFMTPYGARFLQKPTGLGVVAAGMSYGQPRGGVEKGPSLMVERGLLRDLDKNGWEVSYNGLIDFSQVEKDAGDDPDFGMVKHPRKVGGACKLVAEQVTQHAKDGKMVLTLGGDHSMAVGSIRGLCSAHSELSVIWVDAHGDINTPGGTDSGNLHGMPVAFLLGLAGCRDVPGFEWAAPCLHPSRIVYIGLRDLDNFEKRILRELNIKTFTMHEVDKHGIGRVVDMALDHINPKRSLPLHLSFDVDSLDPTVVPGTGTPVRGGLTWREGHYLCEAVWETGLMVGMDLVEVNPSLVDDPMDKSETVSIGCSLVRAGLGESLS